MFILAGIIVSAAAGLLVSTVQTTKASTLLDKSINFSVGNLPDSPIIMKKGETRIIPFTVMSLGQEPLNLKITATERGKEGIALASQKEMLPQGISAVVSKTSENLPAGTQTGIIDRDTVNLTISVDPMAKDGTYHLSVVLSQDDDTGRLLSFGYVTVQVQG
jgi:hypothetical protein